MTPEGRVKVDVRTLLEDNGVWCFMPVQMGMGRAGIPDIIACVNGHFLGIECKAGKGKTTALQDRELARIQDAGGMALIVDDKPESMAQLFSTIQSLKQRKIT